mgnify:CR=1 FL=1
MGRRARRLLEAASARTPLHEVLRTRHRMGAGPRATRPFVERSPRFADGRFSSAEPTRRPGAWALLRVLAAAVRARGRGRPAGAIPVVPARPPQTPGALAVTWYGHATTILEVDGARFLLDPVFAERVSPSTWVGPQRMHPPPGRIADIPTIDAVLISHDHYDHLDEPSIQALEEHHAPRYVVPLGVDAHLLAWGVPPERVTALDWRETTEVSGIRLTCTEARHNSGRGLRDRQTLWAGWAAVGPEHSAYFAGDSGPSRCFAGIGAEVGPFDLTILPVGAYDPLWPDIHLDPEEAVAAHAAVNAAPVVAGRSTAGGGEGARPGVLLPVHWATFNLAPHSWADPVRRTRRAAWDAGVPLVTPRVGERVDLSAGELDELVSRFQQPWWESCCAAADRG